MLSTEFKLKELQQTLPLTEQLLNAASPIIKAVTIGKKSVRKQVPVPCRFLGLDCTRQVFFVSLLIDKVVSFVAYKVQQLVWAQSYLYYIIIITFKIVYCLFRNYNYNFSALNTLATQLINVDTWSFYPLYVDTRKMSLLLLFH